METRGWLRSGVIGLVFQVDYQVSFSHVETEENPHKRHLISHSQTSCLSLSSKEYKIRANLMKQKTVDSAVADKKD